jgi:GMP synthase (glutamine-hydrolysing)
MAKIHFLQHVPYEGLGSIADWIKKNSHILSATRLYKNEILPDPFDLDFLIIMGGPMGIYEEKKYSWLKEEKIFIEKALEANKKVLGICLGAQLIADVLGAKVYKNRYREIGWFPVRLTKQGRNSRLLDNIPSGLMVFHWHSDTFDIPDNAIHLFENDACRNQGFQYGNNVIGIQFHLEVEKADITRWFTLPDDNEYHNGNDEPYVQSKEEIFSYNHYYNVNRYMDEILYSLEIS